MRPLVHIVISILLLFISGTTNATPHLDKTPQDTYRLTVTLADAVRALRQQQGVKVAWPAVVVKGHKGARHEYQKALEVLSKINRYRIIHKLGPLATPYYPSREITPNEVYDLIQRLINEPCAGT